MVDEIGPEFKALCTIFEAAKRQANYDSPLQVLGDIVTPEGKMLLPIYKSDPWSKGSDEHYGYDIEPAQSLISNGLFEYGGDLKEAEDVDFMKA